MRAKGKNEACARPCLGGMIYVAMRVPWSVGTTKRSHAAQTHTQELFIITRAASGSNFPPPNEASAAH